MWQECSQKKMEEKICGKSVHKKNWRKKFVTRVFTKKIHEKKVCIQKKSPVIIAGRSQFSQSGHFRHMLAYWNGLGKYEIQTKYKLL